MAFWSGLFQRREPYLRSMQAVIFEEADCTELVHVVGESNYQDAIRSICGSDGNSDVALDCVAVLIPEPHNPHDPNAIGVQVDARHVGYLSREDAVAYGPMVGEVAATGRLVACSARIAGREGGRTTNLGVFLKLPPPDEPVELD